MFALAIAVVVVYSTYAIPLHFKMINRGINKNILRKIRKQSKALPNNVFSNFISEILNRLQWDSTSDDDDAENIEGHDIQLFEQLLESHNEEAFQLITELLQNNHGWKKISHKDDISVERRYMSPGSFVSKEDAEKGEKHACVRTTGIINCSPEKLFDLFQNNALVSKYNSHVVDMKDLKHYIDEKVPNAWTKLTWSLGPTYGPIKARDFVSVVQFRKNADGSYLILNRPAYHPEYPPSEKYVRATILLAGNLLQPYGNKGDKTLLTQIAHVNPGGGADTPALAWMINKICTKGPPTFIKKLEATANSIFHSKKD